MFHVTSRSGLAFKLETGNPDLPSRSLRDPLARDVLVLRHAERDDGRFDTLSAHGRAALRTFARYSGEMAWGNNRG
jgi:hypothetical protein